MLGAPGVQKNVARAAVKAGDGTVALHRREERDVGNAADVDDTAGDVAREDLRVESGHQGGPFTARSDVARAEVCNDVEAGKFRHHCGVVQLQRPAFFGAVTDRLAVNAGGGDFFAGNIGGI